MKTLPGEAAPADAPILLAARVEEAGGLEAAPVAAGPPPDATLPRARAFAEPLLAGRTLDTGEEAWAHASEVAQILRGIGADDSLQAAVYLVYAGEALQRPEETVTRAFGASYGSLVGLTRRLVAIQRAAREAALEAQRHELQLERVRKMLLAFSRDLRVVLLRLASRLQTLRWHAAARRPCPAGLARESLEVFAPLANRLGIWPFKWELEDLAFRLLQPEDYHAVARLLDERRSARELALTFARHQLEGVLRLAGVPAEVQGRAKHLYGIWKKMRGKNLAFDHVLDLRALRVIVEDVPACYAALSAVHARYRPLPGEFDDYIARPKPNGYQSLHTVVAGDDSRPVEVQIRTRAMHERAEHGAAAHWAYKEAGVRGYVGVSVDDRSAGAVLQARQTVMRQLLAWERDLSETPDAPAGASARPDPEGRVYVLTPQAAVVELPVGATPVDFAYSLHTELGHRCRGARVDGVLVPLTTALASGQTVEITAAREGSPSRDWLNTELGYLRSPRARAKVRAWFNAQALRETIGRGRELVERWLQREGRTAWKLDELAARLGFADAQRLFEAVGKDEYPPRNLEQVLRPAPAPEPDEGAPALRASRATTPGGVLVVGVESLLTALSRCCRPAPPDTIGGFVTRGKGVAVHRAGCSNFRHMAQRMPERVIPVAWGEAGSRSGEPLYPVDIAVEAADRPGLLRDVSEVFARERLNVTGVQTHSVADGHGRTARMTFTAEVGEVSRLGPVLRAIGQVPGVRQARRA
ncbi:MAG: RelA/SpoT family protein [Rubrivivax sp.]